MSQAPKTRNLDSKPVRALRKIDISRARWFLAATGSISVFVTLVQHNLWRDSFDLAAIARIELISILLGWLFSLMLLAVLTSNVNKRIASHVAGTEPEQHPDRRLNIETPIVLEVVRMTWPEHLQFAVVSVLGSGLRLFKAICIALIFVAPAIAYSLKSGWIIGAVDSPKSIAVACVLGIFSVAALIGLAVMIRLIPVADRLRTKFCRLTGDILELHVAGGLKESVSWSAVSRVYLTADFFGVEADGRLVLAMPRRAIENEVINRIVEVAKDEFE